MNPDSKVCVKCGHYIEAQANFCPKCGSRQTVFLVCKNCNAKIGQDAAFCSACGSPMINVSSSVETRPFPQTPVEKISEKSKPSMPMSISLGLIFFVISFFVSLLQPSNPAVEAKIASLPADGQAFLVIIFLGSIILTIISLILLCKGYSSGVAFLLIMELLTYLVMISARMYQISINDLFTCIYVVCFLVSPSWDYYADCAQYRVYRREKKR